MQITIKTLMGLEQCLAKEIAELGGEKIEVLHRAVTCEGNLAFLYRANYTLRTALRVLIPIHTLTARNETELYDHLVKFEWSDHLEMRQTFAIDPSLGKNASIKHSMYASLKMKDAIVDYFRNKTGRRPSVNPDNPGVLFNLHGNGDKYTISIDSSGKPLNQRGYRQPGHQAPLNEVLGAGLLMLSGWDPTTPLLDPMCGTGTIPLEAAMMAKNMPVQVLRNEFGFMNWSNFNAILWNRTKSEAAAQVNRRSTAIYANDMNRDAIKMLKSSAGKLKLGTGFEITNENFLNMAVPAASGTIVSNPPYGERLGGDHVDEFYKKIGDKLKHEFTNWNAWLISSNVTALRALRLSPSEKMTLFNGPLECQFCKYELYQGSRGVA